MSEQLTDAERSEFYAWAKSLPRGYSDRDFNLVAAWRQLEAERTRADEATERADSAEHSLDECRLGSRLMHDIIVKARDRAEAAERLAAERAALVVNYRSLVEQAISCLRMGRYTEMADSLRSRLEEAAATASPDHIGDANKMVASDSELSITQLRGPNGEIIETGWIETLPAASPDVKRYPRGKPTPYHQDADGEMVVGASPAPDAREAVVREIVESIRKAADEHQSEREPNEAGLLRMTASAIERAFLDAPQEPAASPSGEQA